MFVKTSSLFVPMVGSSSFTYLFNILSVGLSQSCCCCALFFFSFQVKPACGYFLYSNKLNFVVLWKIMTNHLCISNRRIPVSWHLNSFKHKSDNRIWVKFSNSFYFNLYSLKFIYSTHKSGKQLELKKKVISKSLFNFYFRCWILVLILYLLISSFDNF